MDYKEDVKQTIESLIQAGTSFNIDKLENIYHKNLEVISIDEHGEIMYANKEAFKNLFKMKLENGDAPLNTWAKFNHIQAEKNKAHVLITRKVKLTNVEKQLVLSIDLMNEDNRWQVTREVIFSQPIKE